MGQAFSSLSFLLGVSSPRHRTFAQTKCKCCKTTCTTTTTKTTTEQEEGSPVSSLVRELTEIYRLREEKYELKKSAELAEEQKAKERSMSRLSDLSMIYGAKDESTSWLGPTPPPNTAATTATTPPTTTTAISPAAGVDKFTVPKDMTKLAPADSSVYDTLAVVPGTESQIFKLREGSKETTPSASSDPYENVPSSSQQNSAAFWGPVQPVKKVAGGAATGAAQK